MASGRARAFLLRQQHIGPSSFFSVDRSELTDIPGDEPTIESLPPASKRTNISRIVVIVQVRAEIIRN
jgi:hypothetical protein